MSHDAGGVANPDTPKGIVTQARQLWLFSRLASANYRREEMLAAADHGFRFLHERLWDSRYGGFFWHTDASGRDPIRPKKHLYGQAFALYALSQYALASGSASARALAVELFHLLEKKAHDGEYGGYQEFFNQDWNPSPVGDRDYVDGRPGIKLMNTHLHVLEALTAYYYVRSEAIARERILEMIAILSNTVVRHGLGACTDAHDRKWTPVLDRLRTRVSYGHDVENVWILAHALGAVKLPVAPYLTLFRTLWSYTLHYGFDKEHGGLWHTGLMRQQANDKRKFWWVQAEAILSALTMFRLTNEARYSEVFARTFGFIERYQTDWSIGEWHEVVSPDLQASGGKAHLWKAGFHSGRAMIECIDLLRHGESTVGRDSRSAPSPAHS